MKPWENGGKPYFINEQGYEWYVDKSLTNWAANPKRVGEPLEAVCFTVCKNKKPITRILVGIENQILAEYTGLEDMVIKIDMLRIINKRK
jgi:hypothetical protein